MEQKRVDCFKALGRISLKRLQKITRNLTLDSRIHDKVSNLITPDLKDSATNYTCYIPPEAMHITD
jgi:hypothetical protein